MFSFQEGGTMASPQLKIFFNLEVTKIKFFKQNIQYFQFF